MFCLETKFTPSRLLCRLITNISRVTIISEDWYSFARRIGICSYVEAANAAKAPIDMSYAWNWKLAKLVSFMTLFLTYFPQNHTKTLGMFSPNSTSRIITRRHPRRPRRATASPRARPSPPTLRCRTITPSTRSDRRPSRSRSSTDTQSRHRLENTRNERTKICFYRIVGLRDSHNLFCTALYITIIRSLNFGSTNSVPFNRNEAHMYHITSHHRRIIFTIHWSYGRLDRVVDSICHNCDRGRGDGWFMNENVNKRLDWLPKIGYSDK